MLVLTMKLYNPKNVWRLQRPHQTYSHNLHFKITLSSGRIHPCKDQVYSHNLHFKITELARFNPETVLRQDTLLLYNPKECREGKKVCPFFLLENSRPLSPWGPLDSLSTCLGNDSLTIRLPRPWDSPGKTTGVGCHFLLQAWILGQT